MLEPVSVGLKFGFLAVLYLFLLWVAWKRDARYAARRRGGSARASRQPPPSDATSMYSASARSTASLERGLEPKLLVERAPGHESGMAYE